MPMHHALNYIEFPAINLTATKAFFESCFGWKFTDYGAEYTAFSEATLEGGFFQSSLAASTATGSALVIFYSENLEETLAAVQRCGGKIIQPIFHFPGGRRFHFTEPSGNEMAVWSDQ